MIIVKQKSLRQFAIDYYGDLEVKGCSLQAPSDGWVIPASTTKIGDVIRFERGEDDPCSDTEEWVEFEVVEFDSINNKLKEINKDINYKK